jgi:hypothetical protein
MLTNITEVTTLDQWYGRVACDTRAAPSRRAAWGIALQRGWSHEAFDKWARRKVWSA